MLCHAMEVDSLKENHRYGGGQFNGGRMVILLRWPVYAGRMVMLQKWSPMEGE